jgi:hypothetical protein
MEEEFYCCLKLITGEEVVSLISIDENDGDPIIIMQNPVIIKIFENNMGSFIKVKPWMEVPNDDIFIIKYDKVVTMTEIKDKQTISIYKKYINEESIENHIEDYSQPGKVKLSNTMGYIDSVENARKKLEDIFNSTNTTDS